MAEPQSEDPGSWRQQYDTPGDPWMRRGEPDFPLFTLSPAQWQGKLPPKRNWMVEGCFLQAAVGMLSGDGGIGKSLLVQQLATCACLGRAWLGMAVRAGRALYLSCEDDRDELWRRQVAINRSLDCEMADLGDGGLELAPRVGQDNAVIAFDRFTRQPIVTSLWKGITQHCRRNGIQYVFLDTATHVFNGNQNDETQVVSFVSELRRLAIALQGLVVFTKHPSLSGQANGSGQSGNVAWNNSVRSRLYLHQSEEQGLVLETMKSNYGPKNGKIPLVWRDGVFVRNEPEPAPQPYWVEA